MVVMRVRHLVPLLAALVAGSTAACGVLPSSDGRPTAVVSFYPLQFITERIAGGHVRIVDLTAPGVEPHDLELKVRQVAEIDQADVVVYESRLQPAVDDAVAQNAKDHALDVAPKVDLQEGNPHFWLDPLRLAQAAAAVEQRLASIDPEHAADYATNLATLDASLRDVDRAFTQGLQDCERHVIVTSHDAFGYWSRYGVHSASIAGLSPDAEPSAAHLTQLRSLIEEDHITTVFSETLASPKMADVLSHDLGLATAVLDPIEGVAHGSSENYLSIMRTNLAALQRANGCKVSS
jgi:zinc transport system substrate-binding protein